MGSPTERKVAIRAPIITKSLNSINQQVDNT